MSKHVGCSVCFGSGFDIDGKRCPFMCNPGIAATRVEPSPFALCERTIRKIYDELISMDDARDDDPALVYLRSLLPDPRRKAMEEAVRNSYCGLDDNAYRLIVDAALGVKP